MKLTKVEKRKIIDGLLPQLDPAFSETKGKKMVEGKSLIGRNILRDIGGQRIVPGRLYEVDEIKKIPIDHRARMSAIITKAKDFDDLGTKLAEYLVTYSKP